MEPGAVVHRAPWVLPIAGPPLQDAEVVVADGVIQEVRPATRGPATNHANALLMPAFTNAHSHLEYTMFRNLNELWPFVAWIQRVAPLKLSATEEELAASALIGAVENARAGVGLIGDFSDAPVSAGAIAAAGLRGVVFQEFICIRDEPRHGEQLAACEERARRSLAEGGEAVTVHVAPHATYSVVGPMLARFAQGRAAIHCAESVEEEAFLLDGSGEFGAAFEREGISWDPPGQSPVPYLRSLGLLRPEVQLVHCVQLGADDIDAIAQSGAGVAHCPKSNAKLAVGAAPIRELLDAGVPTGLGTDSLMSNNRVDMFEEMRMAAFLNSLRGKPPIQPRRLLRMAMLDGARTLGRDGECGSLEPGKRADFVVVSLDGAHFAPLSDVEAALVYCGCAADVRALHIGGREVDAGAERLDGAREACARALPRIIAQAGQRPRPAASAGAQSSE